MTAQDKRHLIAILLSMGFQQTEPNQLYLEVNENLKISIITDYQPYNVWVQFQDKNGYTGERGLPDNYCQSLNEILTSLGEHMYHLGMDAQKAIVRERLSLN